MSSSPLSPIALIPLDDRPCNTRFPVEITRIAGGEILLPPPELLGWFTRPARCEDIANWLRSLPSSLDALVTSVDMLAYGGLVAARTTATSLDTARARLSVLREWRRAHPHVPVYAFNVIRRLAPTVDCDEMLVCSHLLQRYAILRDQVAHGGDAQLIAELERVEHALPADVLADYLASRQRNHAINAEMLRWLAEGVFDFLLMPQEDCAEFGLHRAEQAALEKEAASLGVTDRVAIHPGADEAALTLLARHWNRAAPRPVTFHVIYSDAEDARRIPPFEDRPLRESVSQHIAAAGGVEVGEAEADVLLFVNAPTPFPRSSMNDEISVRRAEGLRPFVERIAAAISHGRRAAIADVAFPNGADFVFVDQLRQRVPIHRLLSFAAWNTAGNTIGTVLAQCVANSVAPQPQPLLNAQFLFARIVDDVFYQAAVRTEIEQRAREEFKASPFQLGDAWKPCERLTRQSLGALARLLFRQYFRHQAIGTPQGVAPKELRCDISLPWGRTFEVDVDVRFET
jgi:hypothetical protein